MMIKRLLVLVMSFCFLSVGVQLPAHAEAVGTADYLQVLDRQSNLATIDAALMRDDVQRQLASLGVDAADAQARVARLSDVELATLAEQVDSLPAGGSVFAVIGIVFVVLLILEVTGVIDIFKGT